MPRRSADLHGNAPDEAPTAVLLIDCINDLEFESGERLLRPALAAARRIAALAAAARRHRVPVVYVNDNFGRWRSDFRTLVAHCLRDGVRGEPMARLLAPADEDYFVLKPKHSGFYGTSLELLLHHFGACALILTGITTESCVLATAQDAWLRDYHLHVPADCVASADPDAHARALRHLSTTLGATITPTRDLDPSRDIRLGSKPDGARPAPDDRRAPTRARRPRAKRGARTR